MNTILKLFETGPGTSPTQYVGSGVVVGSYMEKIVGATVVDDEGRCLGFISKALPEPIEATGPHEVNLTLQLNEPLLGEMPMRKILKKVKKANNDFEERFNLELRNYIIKELVNREMFDAIPKVGKGDELNPVERRVVAEIRNEFFGCRLEDMSDSRSDYS